LLAAMVSLLTNCWLSYQPSQGAMTQTL
jgi:hypothetical protein